MLVTSYAVLFHLQESSTLFEQFDFGYYPALKERNHQWLQLKFTCRNCGGGDRGRVTIYRPFGEFCRAKSYCHLKTWWNVSTVHDLLEQWSRDDAASRKPGSEQPRGTTEREGHRIRRMAMAHRPASTAEIRNAICTTVTQQIVINWLLQGQIQARTTGFLHISAYSTDSKPLSFATPVVSRHSSLEVGMEICCVF
ncbi:uncharacterized protein TNCV_1225101 [Trichonephila clavipes]|nr:uncharacterized protein TNCV_1225101 [Trichonephila clavipes]